MPRQPPSPLLHSSEPISKTCPLPLQRSLRPAWCSRKRATGSSKPGSRGGPIGLLLGDDDFALPRRVRQTGHARREAVDDPMLDDPRRLVDRVELLGRHENARGLGAKSGRSRRIDGRCAHICSDERRTQRGRIDDRDRKPRPAQGPKEASPFYHRSRRS